MSIGDLAKELEKLAAWSAATPIEGYSATVWRRDAFGWAIKYDEYGQNSEYGWHIDHVVPLALGGLAAVANTRALHWRCNTGLGGLLGSMLRDTA